MAKFIESRNGEPLLARYDKPYQEFFKKINTNDLETALSLSSNVKHIEFLRQLCLPKFQGKTPKPYSVACIAKACGLTLPELNVFWRDANMGRARDIAFAGIPRAMADVVEDSCNTQVVCPRCDGMGTLDPGPDYDEEISVRKRKKSTVRTCPECEGIGKVKKSGDIESRKLLFETTGMTGKKGPMIAIQNNTYGPSSLESFVDTFDKLDSGSALPMIEGETEPIQ